MDALEKTGWDVLLTTDRGFKNQQNLASRAIGILVVEVHPSTRRRLLALAHRIESEIEEAKPGTIRVFAP